MRSGYNCLAKRETLVFHRCLCNKNQLTIVELKITIGRWIPDQLAIYKHEEGDKIESTEKKTLA